MTTLMDRPTSTLQRNTARHLSVSPVAVVTASPGQYAILEVAQAYLALGERPIPLCDSHHELASAQHRIGYQRRDGTLVSPCNSPGKAPLERNYPRFARERPIEADVLRMFHSHQGNIGGVVPEGRIVIDIDPRSGGLESVASFTGSHGTFRATPTAITGGGGFHSYFLLPPDVNVPSGGSLAASGYPGMEWKAAGSQVVLPPSVHQSSKPYRWEPGLALGELPLALIPEFLLQLILEQIDDASGRPSHLADSRSVKYSVQPQAAQEHFSALWHKVGLDVEPGSGDQFFSCPFHQEQNPSMHIDAQRCIWFCFSPQCPGHHGGGVRELEAVVGPLPQGPLPTGLVCHVMTPGDNANVSALESNPHPNDDIPDTGPVLEKLKSRARKLFPLPEGQQPKVISRLCAFVQDPSRVIRHETISNIWTNPVNRALKRRQYWVHLGQQIALADVGVLYEISISAADWGTRKREALATQVRRGGGQYAAFDNRAIAGVVRFLTSVPIRNAVPAEDIHSVLYEALRDLDISEDTEPSQRVHLVWLSKGWSLPAHKSKGTVRTIAFKRGVDPADDAREVEQARQMGLKTWQGGESDDPQQWGPPRYFAVPPEKVMKIGPERTFDKLLEFAAKLGYQTVRDVRRHFFPETL